MSRGKNTLKKFLTIAAGDMSASITSGATNIQFLDNVGAQLHFTGTPTGTFSVEVSMDHEQDSQGAVSVAGNWVALPLSPSPVASGAADDIYIDMNQLSAPWIRLKYTRTSGTGTLAAYICAKEV